MRANQKKSLKIIILIIAVIILIAAISVGVYFVIKNRQMRYYLVELSTNANGITLSGESKGLAPSATIISRPVLVNVTENSSSSFLRAKIIFSSDSEDNRVLSFVNQLNNAIKDTQTYISNYYSWQYNENDNSFYLISSQGNLKTVYSTDDNYYFLEKLTVPSSIKQISSLNSDGENVQIGENITIKVTFEAIQTIDILENEAPTIKNVSPHFNNFAIYKENGFTSENGYIINFSGSAKSLILPKFVGEDYIIGIKPNAFNSQDLEKIVIPGSYIYFADNCFSSCTNLKYVAIKSETPVKLSSTAFTANANLEIYVPSTNLSYIKQNYAALPYINNVKNYITVTTNKTSEIDANAVAIYAPNVTEFEGNFRNFTRLKLLMAPNLTTISDSMFKENVTLIECDTPNVTTIENSAFNGCTSLINASFSKKLQNIGETAFLGCSNLLNINFAKNASVISREAFRSCGSITNVKFENENVTIGAGAFFLCSNLRVVEISKITKIDSYALSQCNNLRYVKINDINSTDINANCINNSTNAIFVFTTETSRTSFSANVPALASKTALVKIEDQVLLKFEGNIRNLNLAEFGLITKIKEIGNNAFQDNTGVISINIPSSVTKLGDNIFVGCTSLNSITINNSAIPEVTTNTFEGVKEDFTIYVPSNLLNLYKKSFENYNFTILSIN